MSDPLDPHAFAPDDTVLGGPLLVTVTRPDGPRAPVSGPPFTDAVPVRAVTMDSMPGAPGSPVIPFLHLEVDTDSDGAALLRGQRRQGSLLTDNLAVYVHPTGNGYVGLEIVETVPDKPAGHPESGPRILRVSIDPAAHAKGLAAVMRSGRLCLAYRWYDEDGEQQRSLLPRPIAASALAPIVQAALAHPRTVPLTITDPRTPPHRTG